MDERGGMADTSGRQPPPAQGGKAATWLSSVFEVSPAGLNWPRGVTRSRPHPAGPPAALRLRRRGLPGAVDAVRRRSRCTRHAPRGPARQTRRETHHHGTTASGLSATLRLHTTRAAARAEPRTGPSSCRQLSSRTRRPEPGRTCAQVNTPVGRANSPKASTGGSLRPRWRDGGGGVTSWRTGRRTRRRARCRLPHGVRPCARAPRRATEPVLRPSRRRSGCRRPACGPH